VALDHVVLNKQKSLKTIKSLDKWLSSTQNAVQDDKNSDGKEICLPDCQLASKECQVPESTYLTTAELSARIKYDVRTIRERLKDSVLFEGVHYIRPFGGRKILFLWEAIVRDIASMSSGGDRAAIPMANGGMLHG
jgi:hypothetical protein